MSSSLKSIYQKISLLGVLACCAGVSAVQALGADETSSSYQLNSREAGGGRSLDMLPNALPSISTHTEEIRKNPWDSSLLIRMVDGFAIPDLKGEVVAKNERAYANHPEQLKKMIERGRPYLYYMVNEIERRGMPLEIALLPMIESAFNPYAYSRARASGLWQIIPSTGRNLGLNQTRDRDERRDVMAATRSALDYLEYLHRLFSDWQLALAAYNWGEGALARSVARTRAQGVEVTYWSVSMPAETRNYVPKLQALKNIVRNPATYGIELPVISDRPYFRSVQMDTSIGIERAAALADISVREFSSLNPSFKNATISGNASNQYRLLIPVDKVEAFKGRLKGDVAVTSPIMAISSMEASANKREETDEFNPSGWVSYQLKDQAVQESEDLVPHFGLSVSVEELKNPSSAGVHETRIGAGETVSVPFDSVQPTLATALAIEETDTQDLSVKWISHPIVRRETLFSIARHYGVAEDDIRRWNHLGSKGLHAGKILKIRILKDN